MENQTSKLLAIDPGCIQSAAVWFRDGQIIEAGIFSNEELLGRILEHNPHYNGKQADHLAIEMIASYGMPVGKEVFETVLWIGRFIERFNGPFTKVYRKDVKMNLCGSMKAKDGSIRQALLDRIGPQGTKKSPGPTYGISKDMWSALAVGITWIDQQTSSEN